MWAQKAKCFLKLLKVFTKETVCSHYKYNELCCWYPFNKRRNVKNTINSNRKHYMSYMTVVRIFHSIWKSTVKIDKLKQMHKLYMICKLIMCKRIKKRRIKTFSWHGKDWQTCWMDASFWFDSKPETGIMLRNISGVIIQKIQPFNFKCGIHRKRSHKKKMKYSEFSARKKNMAAHEWNWRRKLPGWNGQIFGSLDSSSHRSFMTKTGHTKSHREKPVNQSEKNNAVDWNWEKCLHKKVVLACHSVNPV